MAPLLAPAKTRFVSVGEMASALMPSCSLCTKRGLACCQCNPPSRLRHNARPPVHNCGTCPALNASGARARPSSVAARQISVNVCPPSRERCNDSPSRMAYNVCASCGSTTTVLIVPRAASCQSPSAETRHNPCSDAPHNDAPSPDKAPLVNCARPSAVSNPRAVSDFRFWQGSSAKAGLSGPRLAQTPPIPNGSLAAGIWQARANAR